MVGLIGGLAAGARYLIDHEIALRNRSRFPFGIFVVNILGSFLIGLAAGSSLDGQDLVIVAGGAIGSFTTFSTWIFDSHRLIAAQAATFAWLNIGVSTVVGFIAVAVGHSI